MQSKKDDYNRAVQKAKMFLQAPCCMQSDYCHCLILSDKGKSYSKDLPWRASETVTSKGSYCLINFSVKIRHGYLLNPKSLILENWILDSDWNMETYIRGIINYAHQKFMTMIHIN